MEPLRPKRLQPGDTIAVAGLSGPVIPTVKDIVLDVLADYDFPILAGVDFGHTGPNLPMPIGTLAAVDVTARSLRLLEPSVD